MNCEECLNKDKKCQICKHSRDVYITNLDFYEIAKTIEHSSGKSRTVYKDGIRAEKIIARKYGGKVVVASGALAHEVLGLCGDVVLPEYNVLVQSKTKSRPGPESIRIQRSWIDKHWDQSHGVGRIPSLFFSFYDKLNFWAIYNPITDEDLELDIKKGSNCSVKFERGELQYARRLIFAEDEDNTYVVSTVEDFLEKLNAENQST